MIISMPKRKQVAMISIEQWRARIGLFNNKRSCSDFVSFFFSLVFFHSCYRKKVRLREYSSTADTPPACSTDLTSPAVSLNRSTSTSASTTTTSSSTTTTSRQSSLSSSLLSLRRSLLGDVLIILLITIISQQLLMSGDIETNPGPRRGADDKPGLDDLLYMSYTGESGRDVHFRLMQRVQPHWRELAIALKFPQYEIAIMEHKENPVLYLLSEWLRGANQEKDPRPVTWRTLIEALRHANVQEEATVLEKHMIEIPVTVPNFGSFRTFVDRLKQVYQAPPPTWDPLPQCGHIKLAMIREKGKRRGIADEEMVKHQMKGEVAAIMAGKVPVEKDKIFDSGLFDQERQVILVEGPPGGGKTSLAYYFGQKWASGNLSMFQGVAFVRLRDLAVTPANTLPDLLLLACYTTKDDKLIMEELIQQYAVNCPKLLLVLDGWDEAPNEIRKPLYITNILRSITSQSKILITSRPDSSVDLHGLANRVEIVGFTEENMHEYFREALSTELDHEKVEDGHRKLKEHFRKYPVIQGCCSIPLNAAILASLFLSEQNLPATRHELFLMLVLSRINRELQDRNSLQDTEYTCVSSLDDLPHDIRVHLNHICVLAFEGVKQNKVVFTQEDLTHQKLPHDLPGLSVLQIVDSFIAIGGKTAYRYFIHLSIQELLAAYHISQLGEDEQVKVFEAMLDEPRFPAVLQFYAAFTRLTNHGVRNIITTERYFDGTESSMPALFYFIRCFFEANIHEQSLYKQIILRLNGKLNLSYVAMTPLDCLSVGYFMALLLRAGGEVSVCLSGCSIDDYLLGLLVKEFSKHAEVCPTGVVQASVTKLDISGNYQITEVGIIDHIFQTRITKGLIAHRCNISDLGAKLLARALAVNRTLEYLDISGNKIGDDGIAYIATALLTNSTLKTLDVNECGTSDLGAESLASALAVNSSLEFMSINSSNVGDDGIGDIATALLTNTTLKTLNASGCEISELGAESLARTLAVNSSLECLDICYDYIGDDGIAHIATALLTNTSLKQFDASGCGTSALGVESLARALAVNSSLESLNINSNNIGDDGIAHIATALLTNTTLKTLDASGCETSDIGAESLARALAANSSLEYLDISDNNIGDNGIAHIAKSLPKKNTLKMLNVGKKMYKKVKVSDKVTGLTDTAVLSLAKVVATNTSMEVLTIRCCLTDPESTLKKMAENVKISSLKRLLLYIGMLILPSGEAPVSVEEQREWYQHLEVGGKELILSLEDSNLEMFSLIVSDFKRHHLEQLYWRSQTLKAAADSLNSARHKKGLPHINITTHDRD